jgi:signal transduction histidine kinase
VQFLAAGVLVLLVVVVATVPLSRQAAEREAISDARDTTELLAASVAQPVIPRGLVRAEAGAIDRFDRVARDRLLVGDVRRVKLWTQRGRIVWSDEIRLIGDRFPLEDDERDVLRKGDSDAGLSDLADPENRFEDPSEPLVEVYTRVESPEGEPLLFEAYYSARDIAQRRQQVYDAFWPISLGGLLALVVVATPLIWVLTRRLDRIGRDRARLLEAAADASEYERRRIARDLHDGVVQDLAGTSFALSAVVRDPETDVRTIERLTPMVGSLQSGLRSLRSLLVEIYPPDLGVDGLGAALQDLVAPATGRGVVPVVEVYDVEGASDESVRLLWRVAQEAVRNALRHGHPEHLTVQVGRVGDRLTLDVTDDGIGFDSDHSSSTGLGLRSLRDLIREAGGRLDVRSSPGHGTTVHLEVEP